VVVDLFNDVAIEAAFGFSFEVLRSGELGVREGMGEVDEEGLLLILFDELDGFVGVALSEGGHIGAALDDFLVSQKVNDLVIAGGGAEEIVESLTAREEFIDPDFLRVGGDSAMVISFE